MSKCSIPLLNHWSPGQRAALAAAMAERWIPVYDRFSEEEQWGDAAGLHRILDAVWDHAGGHKRLTNTDVDRMTAQIEESTPHMDDFEAPEALVACIILKDALRCCRTTENGPFAVQAVLSCFEAGAPDWEFDPTILSRASGGR